MRILNHNNGGFTLAEVMVAMLITLVGLLGLLKAAEVATEQNLKNATRDEALQIAEEKMISFRARPFDQISSVTSPYNYAPESVRSRLRGVSTNYTVLKTVTVLSDSSKLVQVRARWKFKNSWISQGVESVVSQPTQSPS